ncbi:FliH/SctL family protein [Arthrobacter livingstonensis]|uniref:FliH/SctL family protein n=1 Tax=Arthrobacter livingstonensis TaxID=670078 RepID=UPI001B8763AF|nr:FliH/SctL family protein [Arthrobacter livingstonensis]
MPTNSAAGLRGALEPIVFPAVPTAEQARSHADAMERGHQRGHTLGYAAGLQRARVEADVRRAALEAEHGALLADLRERAAAQAAVLAATGAALAARTAPVLADAEQTLIDCALTLAEAVLVRELDDGDTRAKAVLARVLASQDPAGAPRVRLHPQDLAALSAEALAAAGLDAVADPAIAPGDAVAEYPDGFLDARISTALDRARRALQETPA